MMIQSHFWTVSFVFTAFMAFKFSSGKQQTRDTSTGGFVVRNKVPDGSCAVGSCKQHLESLVTQSGKAAGVQVTESAPQDRSRENNIVRAAVEKGDLIGLERILESRKADLDPIGVDGQTPAMSAAKTGNLYMFMLLAKYGADMTVIDKSGSNILHFGVKGGNINIVFFILIHRDTLDVNRKDDHGQTPLMIANSKGYDGIADLIRRTS